MITRVLVSTLLLLTNSAGWAADTHDLAVEKAPAAQVMLFGVFHFANPGHDFVKEKVIDVSTAKNQQYLENLTAKFAKQSPTHVMLECDPALQEKYDRQFHSYLSGEHNLTISEGQQLGFRIAAKAGLAGIICYDETNVHFKGERLMEYLRTVSPERKKLYDEKIQKIGELANYQYQTFSLGRLLKQRNSPSEDRENMNLYLMVNDLEAGEEFVGADASASWWHRNFRMYANIQAVAQPGTKVIAIAGSGHTAILRTLLATDLAREAWDVNEYL